MGTEEGGLSEGGNMGHDNMLGPRQLSGSSKIFLALWSTHYPHVGRDTGY